MVSIPSSFVMTTTLSAALHGAAVVFWLSMSQPMLAAGKSIELQLVLAEDNSAKAKAEADMKKAVKPSAVHTSPDASYKKQTAITETADSSVLVSIKADTAVSLSQQKKIADNFIVADTLAAKLSSNSMKDNIMKKAKDRSRDMARNHTSDQTQETSNTITQLLQSETFSDESLISASTKQYDQQHSMLQLLHARISDNKEYPYIAQRQRREGVAKVAFVLNPDGSIDNTRLVTSSRASVLDRAALSAVRAIAPFEPAQYYLEQAEVFEIDVVFKLL